VLGDFGLARIIQHDAATQHSTQVMGRHRGYAYESFFTGHACLDKDVCTFRVFAQELVSGRRLSSPVPRNDEASFGRVQPSMHIADWPWRLYGEGEGAEQRVHLDERGEAVDELRHGVHVLVIVIRTGPDIEPVRPSVRWFTGPTVKNRLNHWFDCFGPDELNRSQIL
jgi:hypothetical protein